MKKRLLLSLSATLCAVFAFAADDQTFTIESWKTNYTLTADSEAGTKVAVITLIPDGDEFGNTGELTITCTSTNGQTLFGADYFQIYYNDNCDLTFSTHTNIVLKKLVFNFKNTKSFNATASCGTFTSTKTQVASKTWNFSSGTNEVTFSGITRATNLYSGSPQISSIVVTYENTATSGVEDIAVETEGEAVYYSLDGRIVTDFENAANGFYVRVVNGRSCVILKN
ncbi:MAG: hypothetical protein ACI4AM_08830 [Muribaculaceae bacterium]